MELIIVGYGRMGHMIEDLALAAGHEIIGRIDIDNLSDLDSLPKCDCVLDFSGPAVLDRVISYVSRTGSALVSGTTGLGNEDIEKLRILSKKAPVIHSTNYSLGIALLNRAVRQASALLGEDFDCEIVETHHNKKLDSPSGTAKTLLSSVDPEGVRPVVYGREGMGLRQKGEIGVHSLRGGTEAGEHTVAFFGEDEVIEFKHRASSRKIFAAGALRAAAALSGMPAGFYTVSDILFRD